MLNDRRGDLSPWGLGLSGLQRREFVLVFLLFAPYYLLFQKASGQVSAADAECDRQTKHQGPEGNSESNEHGLFRQSQLLKHDRQYKNDDDAADGETQHLGRRHIRIYGGQQGGPGKKTGGQQSDEQDEQRDKKARQEEKEPCDFVLHAEDAKHAYTQEDKA